MNVFDPSAGFNAFAQGAQIGGNIRQRQTEAKLAPMVAAGDYGGAAKYAAERGDLPSAELYRTQYGEQLKGMKAEELAAAQKRAEDLARTAYGLKGVPYEQRRAALQQQMPLLQSMGIDPQALAQFDPTDQAIDGVLAQVTPLADLLKSPEYGFQNVAGVGLVRTDPRAGVAEVAVAANREPIEINGVLIDPVTYEPIADYRTPAQTGGMTDYQRQQLAIEARRLGLTERELLLKISQAEREAASGGKREMREDSTGILRYVDDGTPVFADDAIKPKPMIGAESMGRVAAGLPGAVESVATLKRLNEEGYDPFYDWGAAATQGVGEIPIVGGLFRGATDPASRFFGGQDFADFNQAYDQFEAAVLPIMSGAAITPEEGQRLLAPIKIRPGDSKATKERKLAQMQRIVDGLQTAAIGDADGFRALIASSGSGAPADLTNASDEELFNILGGR